MSAKVRARLGTKELLESARQFYLLVDSADIQPLSGAARLRCSHKSTLMLNRTAVPHPSSARRFRLPSPREDLNWHVQHSEQQQECFVAQPFCDREIVAKYAVVFQARRNRLGLKDGEDDTMEPLPYEMVQQILQDLQDLFNARPDQIRKRKEDQMAWGRFRTKKRSGMQSSTKRAKGRFVAMIPHIFGVEVGNPDVDVGAPSPDVKIKKIDGVAVARDLVTHGVMQWNDFVGSHAFSFLCRSP